jgi:hypothetical protein
MMSNADVIESYKNESGYDPTDPECVVNVLNLSPVTRTGNVVPYKPWVADAFYDYMQSKTT